MKKQPSTLNYNQLLIEALQRAFTGKTELIPVEEVKLPKGPTEKDSVAVGSIADDPLLRALFCERLQCGITLESINGRIQAATKVTKDTVSAMKEFGEYKEGVFDKISEIFFVGLRAKFCELEGQNIEVISGLKVYKSPPQQAEMNPLAAMLLGGGLFHH